MSGPAIPVSSQPVSAPIVVAVGDHGTTVVAHLVDALGGNVYLPSMSTAAFAAVERPAAATKARRAQRTMAGAATISGSDASLVSYVMLAADTALAGVFDWSFVVTTPDGSVVTFPGGVLEIS